MRTYLGTMFKLEPYRGEEEDEELQQGANKVMLTCMGSGYNKV